jgi:hypothetical protein
MSFLNPAMLGALVLVAVPLLVHLLRRRRLQVIPWAAMEFLRLSQRKQSRRLRIEELILLAIRIAIIACAVLAFARPVLRALGIPLLSSNAPVYAVVVLDNSMSMEFKGPDGVSSLTRGKDVVNQILTKILRPGDSASLVLMSDRADALVNAPSYDLRLVAERLRKVISADRGTDYRATARAVAALLKQSRTPAREVYWITDDQATGWSSSHNGSSAAVWQEVTRQARVTWVSVGTPPNQRDNAAVRTPLLSGEMVTPHMPVRIEATIANYGASPRSDQLVDLAIDGVPVGSVKVAVPAGGTATAQFLTTIPRPGAHTGTVSLTDPQHADGLVQDNSAAFAIGVRDRIRTLVQDPRPAGDPAKDPAFYVMAAAAPGGSSESIEPHLHTGGLSEAGLRGYDLAILTDLSVISASDADALAAYVQRGGGLLIFPGPETNAQNANSILGKAGLLPARLGARTTLPEDQQLAINPATINSPSLAMFRDTSSLNLASARIDTYFGLAPVTDIPDPTDVSIMVRLNNQEPALVERKVGQGRVVICATSADARWSQLPLKPSFVPLLYTLAGHAGQGTGTKRNLKLGEPITTILPIADADHNVTLTLPDGKTISQKATTTPQGVTVQFPPVETAGIYHLKVDGSSDTDTFAVGLPEDESDLRAQDPTIGAQNAGISRGVAFVKSSRELAASIRRSRYGSEIWRPLIWAVVALLFVESMLAQRFGRRG